MRKHTHIITLHIHAQINGQAENDAFGMGSGGTKIKTVQLTLF